MGLGRMGQSRPLAAGDKAPVAVLPVRQVRARLLSLDEGRLVAPVIDTAHRVQMRFAADECVHQVALLPDRPGPVGIVRLGQHIRARLPSEFCACSTTATALAKNSSKIAGSLSRSLVTTMTGITTSLARRPRTGQPVPTM